MSWTYGGDPLANTRDELRFLVGDTDTSNQLLNDAEIAYANAQFPGNVKLAAAYAAKAIAAIFSRRADKQVGDLRITYSQQMKQYLDLAKKFEAEGSRAGARPYAGGITVSDKQAVNLDADRVKPSFRRGEFDFNQSIANDGRDVLDNPVEGF